MPETTPGQPMEEILASIKRIIAEDAPLTFGPAVLAVADDPKPDAEDVLELGGPEPNTEPEPAFDPAHAVHPGTSPEEPAAAPAFAPEPTPYPAPEPPATHPVAESHSAAEPKPIHAVPVEPKPAHAAYETLLSAGAEAASRQALAALTALTIDPRAEPNTLDGLVREMLRPMLREWLDANLPPLVEALVAKEIKRLGRQ